MTKYIKTEMIEKYIKDNNLSMSAFCKICGISLITFYSIMLNKNVLTSSLYKIARGMKVKFCEIFCA